MTDTILITGVTGLVGARLAGALASDGVRVAGVSRDPTGAQRRVPSLARAHAWTTDAPIPPEALEGVRAIVHLAGESVAGRWTAAHKRAIRESRVEGTRRVVDAIAARAPRERPRVLVSASAIGYYGDTGERDVIESDPPATGDFLAEVCVAWEREARRATELGVRVVTPRIGLVMARQGGALERMRPLFAAGLGGALGSGAQWWPWIHVDDVVGILRHAIDRDDLEGPVDATAPSPVRQREFAAVLARVMRRPALLPTPALALRAVLGEFADEVLGSRKVLPRRALETGYRFRFPELEPALADLLARR